LEWADEVRVFDPIRERRTHDWDTVLDSDLVFICVPEDKVEGLFSPHIFGAREEINLVLKSTVPVGTTRRLREKYGLVNLVHSPEFLTARCAETDARIPAMNVIGVPPESLAGTRLNQLYTARFPGTSTKWMSSDESETLKLALNSFFAVKVSFFNELYQFCNKCGVDFETVRAGMLADGRITAHHTRVPGPDGEFGYGGACLPKDLQTLAMCMAEVGEVPVMLSAAKARNTTDRGRGV
jgi:UDPglucose 6-dehydrogenase